MVLTCRSHSVQDKAVSCIQNNEPVTATIERFVADDSGLLYAKNQEPNDMIVPYLK